MNHRTSLIAGAALFVIAIIGIAGMYQYTFNSNGNLFDLLKSSSDAKIIFDGNKDRMDQIHTTIKKTNQSVYLRPWTTGCINTTDKKCVEKSVLNTIGTLAFKNNPKFKQIEHIKDFGQSTWFTIDERKHFDKSREIGIVLVDDPDAFTETFHDSPIYKDLNQLDKQIRENPTANTYAFARVDNGVYIFYQYTLY